MYSRTRVNKAGKVLAFSELYSKEEQVEAHQILAYWRGLHFHPINTFQATLRGRLRSQNMEALVAQRLKRDHSIIRKLRKEGNMGLARMQDIGGLRVVLGTIPQVRTIERLYRQGVGKHELVDSDDYIDTPKSDGYRGIHLVYKYRSEKQPSLNKLRIELQLRTRLQHYWATAVETVGTYLNVSLKSGEGDEDWRYFFEVAANALAHAEQAPPVPGYESLTRYEAYQLLANVQSELAALDKIRRLAIVTDQIVSIGKGKYFLVVLDASQRTVSIKSYTAKEYELANKAYSELQVAVGYGEEYDCVLVSVESIHSLKQAYPNYFLDTHEFVQQIEKLTKAADVYIGKPIFPVKRDRKERSPAPSKNHNEQSINSSEIPQAEDIYTIRKVVSAINEGCSTIECISARTGLSYRHVNYRVAAGRILGCISINTLALRTEGRAWLRRPHGSTEEMQFLRGLIEDTVFYRTLVPDLFAIPGPSRAKVAKKISDSTGLSPATADRRALTLLTWAETVRQGTLALRH